MRLHKLIFLAFLTLCVTACSKEDESTNTNSNTNTGSTGGGEQEQEEEETIEILGTWSAAELTSQINEVRISSQTGNTSETDYTLEGFDIDFTITFTENPNNSSTQGTYSGELFEDGQPGSQTFTDLTYENFLGEWVLDNDQITFTTPLDYTGIATITLLTENTLRYEYLLVESFTTGNGDEITNTINQSARFTR
ncbi:MAG: hypothetical protein KTR22_13640 [Flavobacteriaceae bacterium]|nr:hypothetical protein [Flavobacteriaceae bacterium]